MINWMRLFSVIAMIESGNDPTARNEAENAIGVLQIRKGVVKDVNETMGTHVKHEACFDPIISRWFCVHYLKRYDAVSSYEKACRVWNGGPAGMEKESTLGYWKRCKALLDVLSHSQRSNHRSTADIGDQPENTQP